MSTSPDVFTNRHATVTVTIAETFTANDGTVMPRRFRIASDSGYLASLPACGIQHGVEDDRKSCPEPSDHPYGREYEKREHNREHCHNWHADSARRFAKEVLATYGTRKPKPKAPPAIRHRGDVFVPLRELVSA